jgi:hypothetical protein
VAQINGVTEAIQLSNIYHLLKAMERDMQGFVTYLTQNGVPTLVQAVHTGNTPPFVDVEFNMT